MNRSEFINNVLERSTDAIYPNTTALETALNSKKKLRIYHGVDPTGPDLHIGHLTNFLILKWLQELDHEIIFLIGDFTAQIGDPTDKSSARVPLTKEEVKKNLKTFKRQVSRIIRFTGKNPAKLKFNSKWLSDMKLVDVIGLAQRVTVQQMLRRDMFQERIKKEKSIGFHEFFYPLLQGYDSVAMDVDMEIGGSDQTFNMLIGRDLLKEYKQKEKLVLTTKLLEHPITGKKLMNKSEGNVISLDASPKEIFGGVMALDDATIIPVARYSSELALPRVKELERAMAKDMNPRDAKLEVAEAVVMALYGEKPAKEAREHFVRIYSKKDLDTVNAPFKVKKGKQSILDLLLSKQDAKLPNLKSKMNARYLIDHDAIEIDKEIKKEPSEIVDIKGGELLRIGKKFFRIEVI